MASKSPGWLMNNTWIQQDSDVTNSDELSGNE